MKISQKIKNIGVGLLMSTSMLLGVAFLAPTSPVSAAACTDQSSILTFPNWYRGVYQNVADATTGEVECQLFPTNDTNEINGIWVIVTNIVEIVIQIVGYAAVGFIIYGGFKYITSQGEASGITQAKDTITRAVVGLVISIVSVLVLNLVVGIFGLRVDGTCLEVKEATAPKSATKEDNNTTSTGTKLTCGADSDTDKSGKSGIQTPQGATP